jgi:bacillithiol system protein YtxJ
MSFLNKIFGSSETEKATSKLNWNSLTDIGQLDEIIQVSGTKPVLIFKHSTTCSISRMAFKNFENEFDLSSEMEIYFLDLLNYRAISNEIASRFGVVHQSPQILLIKNGVSVYDTSHEDINALKLKELI